MRRIISITAIAISVLFSLFMVGYSLANAGSADKMVGVVVAERNAALEVADQPGATGALKVDRVLAPGASWVVVHLDMDGKPGERVGLAHVDSGESRDVRVSLDPEAKLTEKLLVALHADRGIADTFEFDMDKFESSPDKPYFVDGMELAKAVVAREFGVKADKGEAAIEVDDQPGVTDSLVVARAVAPTDAWIVVHLDDGGKPGERVGLLEIPWGENLEVAVPLNEGVQLTDKLFVAVHADRGEKGTFEFDMMDKINSPDQPFFVNGEEVATAVTVR